MSELKNLIEELQLIQNGDAWHGPGLQKLLEGVTAEQAIRRPSAESHSIWELVLHIAGWEEVFIARLEGHVKSEPADGDFPAIAATDDASWKQALQFLQDAHDRLIKAVSRMQESDLQTTLTKKDYSVAFMLHGLVRHNVYHAGQIGLLKKLI